MMPMLRSFSSMGVSGRGFLVSAAGLLRDREQETARWPRAPVVGRPRMSVMAGNVAVPAVQGPPIPGGVLRLFLGGSRPLSRGIQGRARHGLPGGEAACGRNPPRPDANA